MNESRHTHNWMSLALRRASIQSQGERVMSHTRKYHVTHMTDSVLHCGRLICGWVMSHTHEWVMSHTHEWVMSHTHEWVMSHTHECVMSLTHEWVMNHTGLIESYNDSGFNPATCVNESCHTHEWVMSHTWLIESYIKDGFNPAGILMDKCVHAITPLCWCQVRDTVCSWYLVSSWYIQLIYITYVQPAYC